MKGDSDLTCVRNVSASRILFFSFSVCNITQDSKDIKVKVSPVKDECAEKREDEDEYENEEDEEENEGNNFLPFERNENEMDAEIVDSMQHLKTILLTL